MSARISDATPMATINHLIPEAFDVCASETKAELKAGHSRLSDDKLREAGPKAVADVGHLGGQQQRSNASVWNGAPPSCSVPGTGFVGQFSMNEGQTFARQKRSYRRPRGNEEPSVIPRCLSQTSRDNEAIARTNCLLLLRSKRCMRIPLRLTPAFEQQTHDHGRAK
jgi:hypothetical protein